MKEFKYKGRIVRPYEPFQENASESYFKGSLRGVARTVLADIHPQVVIIEIEKKQILLNGITSDIAPTLTSGYYKYGAATLITGNYGMTGAAILEIEDMQKAINTDANGNAKAIRACYGQCGFDSVFRGTGQGITGVMEQVEPKIVGYSRSSKGSGKVTGRHLKDIANTIHTSTGSGGNTDQYLAEPKIAASRGRGECWKQQLEINENGTSNTITQVSKDDLLMEPKINLIGQYDSSQNSRVVGVDGISYCIANGEKDGVPKIAEPNVLRQERTEKCKLLRKKNGDKGMKWQQGNKQFVPRTDGISNTLSTSTKDNILALPELRVEDGCMVDREGRRYRIRKLTPTECFRLMDVCNDDIDKMLGAGIAKTNLYKLAGNSIVVSCMYHIFRKLFIEKGNESQQLELF